MFKSSHATCNFFTALVCTSMLLSPVNVNAAKMAAPVRYSTGIVTGAKQIETKDGNIWRTKRKLYIRKGAKVTVKFNTCETRKKTDDKILSVKKLPTPQIETCHCDCVR